MDSQTDDHFNDIIRQAPTIFSEVDYVLDSTPERAILRIQAAYGGVYRIFITELIDTQIRKYRYYVLKKSWISIGFDNSPDPRALRLKYGKIGTEHAGEYIPHLHKDNKTHLELTEEMDVYKFIAWIREHLAQ